MAVSSLIYGITLRRHSRALLAGIQKHYQHRVVNSQPGCPTQALGHDAERAVNQNGSCSKDKTMPAISQPTQQSSTVILNYKYPVQILEGHDYVTVAEIFRRVNHQGKTLVTVEVEQFPS